MVVALQALLLSAAGRGERFPVWRADAAELTASMLIAVGVRVFAVDARYIPTDSMEPTFAVGDHLLLDKVSRVFRPPARGDVVLEPLVIGASRRPPAARRPHPQARMALPRRGTSWESRSISCSTRSSDRE